METSDYLDILRRRKWYIVFSILIVLFGGAVYSVVAPEKYKSSTTILVVAQRVPEGYVRSTISTRVDERLFTIRQQVFSITFDTTFAQVIRACGQTRRKEGQGTWLDEKMIEAYCRLHEQGYAHSVECRQNGALVGGLYGVALGAAFFGESMFSLVQDSSKVALAGLVERLKIWDFSLIDCQVGTGHLQRLGAGEISGAEFSARLAEAVTRPSRLGSWGNL